MKLKCIAVDDEPLALNLVCSFIERTPFLELSGQYDNAIDALKAIHEQNLDLIFLDIQMADLTGIELARVIESGKNPHKPRIVFTTAYNQFALEGYKVDALDYLLKPFNYEEFLNAANKALNYVQLLRGGNSNTGNASSESQDYLFLKVEYQLVRVAFKDILYIEGLKDYVKVHLENKTRPILSLTSLKALEEKLPSDRFMRIHRSYIVSLEKISAITKNSIQIGDVNLTVSDSYKEPFQQFLSKWMS